MLPLRGMYGIRPHKTIRLRNVDMIEEAGVISDGESRRYSELLACAGHSIVCDTQDDMLSGIVALSGILRPEVSWSLEGLRSRKLHTESLTGDHESCGREIAMALCITTTAGLTPRGKIERIIDEVTFRARPVGS